MCHPEWRHFAVEKYKRTKFNESMPVRCEEIRNIVNELKCGKSYDCDSVCAKSLKFPIIRHMFYYFVNLLDIFLNLW